MPDPLTFPSVRAEADQQSLAESRLFNEQARREVARETAMLELDRLVDMWGAEQVQRWLDGAIAIRQDPRRS